MKKILIISTVNVEDNGVATFVCNSAVLLTQQGNKVTILAPNKVSSDLNQKLKINQVQVIDDMVRSQVGRYFSRLVKLFKREKYDLVHIHGNSSTMVIELLAAYLGGCQIRIAHSHNTTSGHMFLHKMLRPLFNSLVTGRFACGTDAGKWLYPKDSFYVVNNGIKLENYAYDATKRAKIRQDLQVSEDTILLGNVGRFNGQKNQELLLKMIKKLDENYKLILVGSGPILEQIKSQAKKLGVLDQVIFLGKTNSVSDYLMAMDLFLLPSFFEGLPFSLIEAKATGLPCIISDKISLEANITGDINYLAIDNEQKWVDAVQNIGLSANRKQASMRARKALEKKGYSVSQNIKDMELEYDKLLRG